MSTGDPPLPYQHWIAVSLGHYWPTRGTYQTNPQPEPDVQIVHHQFIQCDYCQTVHVLASLMVLTCHGCGAPLPHPLPPRLMPNNNALEDYSERMWETAKQRYQRRIDEAMQASYAARNQLNNSANRRLGVPA